LLHSFSNAEIISGIVFVILLVFGIGNYFGRIEKDKESLRTDEQLKKIENENISLRHTNDSLRQIVKNLDIKLESIKNDTIKKIR
jgi:cell division protein FtsB